MKEKAFSLVELMGVIVVLGIVTMIVVPNISNIIKDMKQESIKDSAVAYVNAVKTYYQNNVSSPDLKLVEGRNYISDIDSLVEVKGDRPTSGYVYLDDYKITRAEFCIDDYYVNYTSASITTNYIKNCEIKK